MSEQASELALKVWDVLVEVYRERLGPATITDLMRASERSRAEVAYGLRELAQGGWVERRVIERHRQLIEVWQVKERRQSQRRMAEAEAAE
jgi:DNA-binding MarR family transcriptional regulator